MNDNITLKPSGLSVPLVERCRRDFDRTHTWRTMQLLAVFFLSLVSSELCNLAALELYNASEITKCLRNLPVSPSLFRFLFCQFLILFSLLLV
jgi:hypothetical protein